MGDGGFQRGRAMQGGKLKSTRVSMEREKRVKKTQCKVKIAKRRKKTQKNITFGSKYFKVGTTRRLPPRQYQLMILNVPGISGTRTCHDKKKDVQLTIYTCGDKDVFMNDENVFLAFPKISKKPLLTEYN
ncbi:hypothetical protein MTR_1g109190 [Medicago truncatula]|uniref:Uncharacterized protein n=1 Tax=Medicago truncatula TaxID=3880 RepID=A0A072VRT2_MEDTR|nr:hypothetical protein MTR_1g109190 [Medicago truncatula]